MDLDCSQRSDRFTNLTRNSLGGTGIKTRQAMTFLFTSLRLVNFKRFESFSIKLREGNVLVGPNNSGKSSILDAFRLLDACLRNSRTRNPTHIDTSGAGVFPGYFVPETVLPFSLDNISYNYADEDSLIEFSGSNGAKAVIRLHPNRSTRFYIDAHSRWFSTSSKFRAAFPADLIVVPTLAPLEAQEEHVEDETVRRNSSTRLASRVLRNIWLRANDADFNEFKESVRQAWPQVELKKPEFRTRSHPLIVQMFFSENRIDREVQWAGYGFQIWLQLQTHLSRCKPGSTIIIDEPDIYLHPDLQRHLLRDVRRRATQFLMATHATEIINEASSHEIASISPRYRSAKRISSEEDYSELFRYLGASGNADFARIAKARKVIFVEGQDGRLIRRLAARLGLNQLADAQGTAIVQLGGFSQWRRAVDSVWAFKQLLDLEIEVYCLFDRDYRCAREVADFLKSIEDGSFRCSVHQRKEIENQLLIRDALCRAINKRLRARESSEVSSDVAGVNALLERATDPFKHQTSSQLNANLIRYEREMGSHTDVGTILLNFNREFENQWADLDRRLIIVPGKAVLGKFNEIIQTEFKITITEAMIVEQILRTSLDADFIKVMDSLELFCSA
jgi:AAA domain, putative AbiEii toxin, Type IV TA system